MSGKNLDHRRQWIDDELKMLAGAMGIELLGDFDQELAGQLVSGNRRLGVGSRS